MVSGGILCFARKSMSMPRRWILKNDVALSIINDFSTSLNLPVVVVMTTEFSVLFNANIFEFCLQLFLIIVLLA